MADVQPLPPEHQSTITGVIEDEEPSDSALNACLDWFESQNLTDSSIVSHLKNLTSKQSTTNSDSYPYSLCYEVAEIYPSALPNPLPEKAQTNVIAARFNQKERSAYSSFSISTQDNQARLTATVNDDHFGNLQTVWLLHEIFKNSEDWEKAYAIYWQNRDLPEWVDDETPVDDIEFQRGQGFPKIQLEFNDDRDHVLLFSLGHVHSDETGQLLYENVDVKKSADDRLLSTD